MQIAIYYNHFNTLGHATQILALVRAIDQFLPQSKVMIFANKDAAALLPYALRSRVVLLPYPLDIWCDSVAEKCKRLGLQADAGTLERMWQARSRVMRKALVLFKPDIFITEFFPFGNDFWTFEIPPLLKFIHATFDCRVVSSIGFLCFAERAKEIYSHLYDALLVHAPEEFSWLHIKEIEPQAMVDVSQVVQDPLKKIAFTGFLGDFLEKPVTKVGQKRLRGKFARLVFVSRGGGRVNREIILASLMAARNFPDVRFVLCLGPLTKTSERNVYVRMAKGLENVRCVLSMTSAMFNRYMATADACVAMAGHNTVMKLLYFNKPVVCLPYETTEQVWRAHLLRDYLPAVCLRRKEVSAGALTVALRKVLGAPGKVKVQSSWFNGARVTARFLASLR